ncbi:MAG: D-hexose-6-phosphate mutarotase [Proteobacteria bacterium]|nr:D-hexose-6-phosphate mutarotase [Pseudomonadota bacterium]
MIQSVAALNEQYGSEGGLIFAVNPQGLIFAEINNGWCRGRVYLQGGHVTDYQPGKAIRGGIPVCWPWFGSHPSGRMQPAHGFARTTLWNLVATSHNSKGETIITLDLNDCPPTHAIWPHSFSLTLTIIFGASLQLLLAMENRSASPMSLSCALHSYFRVTDWQTCRIHGLDGVDYLDKVEGYARQTQSGMVAFEQETDRIYLIADAACRIAIPESGRDCLISQEGSTATVVWNPGPVKASAMADMIAEEYREMVCVETAIAPQTPLILQPGVTHVLAAEMRSIPK